MKCVSVVLNCLNHDSQTDWEGHTNPFTTYLIKALHFAIQVKPTIFNFWHSGTLVLRTERQSTRMSKIKHFGLDQYGTEPFEQQQFGAAGIEEAKE